MKLTIVKQIELVFSRQITNKELRQELRQNYNIIGRRLDNFTLSALLSIAPMRKQIAQYKNVSLFSVANFFSLDLLQNLVESLHKNHAIKPLDFVATVGNAANYYIAREFSLNGSNIFSAESQRPLTNGLTFAALELAEQRSDAALVMNWQEDEKNRLCQVLLCIRGDHPTTVSVKDLESGSLTNWLIPYSVKL